MVELNANLLSELKLFVDRAINNGETISSIASKAGKAHTTLRRVLTNEVNKCRLETIRSFIEVVTSDEEQNDFLTKYFPEEYGPRNYISKKIKNYQAVDFFLQNMTAFKLYLLAEKGFSKREAIDICGKSSLNYIEIAIQNEWFKFDQQMIKRNGAELKFRASDLIKAINLGSSYLSCEGIESPNHLTYKQMTISRKNAEKIKLHMIQLFNLLETSEQEKSSSDSVTIFVGLILGTLRNFKSIGE